MSRKLFVNVTGIKISLQIVLNPGLYLFELLGASGGGSQPGRGGFASGTLQVRTPLHVYLLPGGKGSYIASSGCLEGGWNGGGQVCTEKYGSSGGGSSDVRLEESNVESRIIVAGGGGGSGDGQSNIENNCPGGEGGGYEGGQAKGFSSHFPNKVIISNGGTQENAGTSTILNYGKYTNTNGNGAI